MGYVFKVDGKETDIQEFKDKLAEAGCEWNVISFIALARKFRLWEECHSGILFHVSLVG